VVYAPRLLRCVGARQQQGASVFFLPQFVTRSFSIMRWGRIWLATLLLSLAALCASAASPKRMLMVFHEDSHVPANVMMEQAVRDKLRDPGADGIEIYPEHPDTNRFADEPHHRLLREYLREKYSGRRPAVIPEVLPPPFDVVGARQGELIPGVPVVFVAVNETDLPGIIAFSSTEEVPPGSPSVLKP
jgi:hypothetical protein